MSAKPLLGGQATVHITVTNTDPTYKAYNISLQDLLSSSRPATSSPHAKATFVSASDGSNLAPTSVTTTPSTGDTTVYFHDMRDLAPGESFSADIVVDISGDPTWKVGDFIENTVSAFGNTIPNRTIPDITATTSASGKVMPIIIKSKVAHQSTGVEQATGTGPGRRYYYTIDVQNNYVGNTQSVVVTDTLPDGVAYLGPHSPSVAPTSVSINASSGVTTLVWNLGTVATSAAIQLAYDAGIRYDYYGSDNAGKQRDETSTALTTTTAGAPIITAATPKKTFVNHVSLGGSWLSSPATDSAQASVTGAALTVAKGGTPGSGGLETTISYTLTYATSQYYSALATNTLTLVHDHLPDGQIFQPSSVSTTPVSVQANSDGSTDITWTVGAIGDTSGGTITFQAVVGTNWQEPSYRGDPIVSGDSMTNTCDIHGICADDVNVARPNITTSTNTSAGFSTSLPTIEKWMSEPTTGTLSKKLTMSIGDTSTVIVRFNTHDGAHPIKTDINMGNIDLTDWMPVGMAMVPSSLDVTYSAASDFTLPTTGTPPPLNIGSAPTTMAVADVTGESWYLGNVAPDGWWQATFQVVIVDTPKISDGEIVANLWKLTGVNTFGTPYSQRDAAIVTYAAPYLKLTKSHTGAAPVVGGQAVDYHLHIVNTGGGDAHRISVVDTLPVGQRTTAPVVDSVALAGNALASGPGYTTSWNPATGALGVDLGPSTLPTDLVSGASLDITYTATMDAGVAAGATYTNLASVGYSTRSTADGHETPRTTNPADDNTDDDAVVVDSLSISKTGSSVPTPTVGDVATYTLDITVPAHTVAYWPTVVDTLNREGITLMGTPAISLVSGSPVASATLAGSAAASSAGSTVMTFDFANPINNSASGSAYTFRITFGARYNAVRTNGSWEFAPGNLTDTLTDSALVRWDTVNTASRQSDFSANSGSINTVFRQPLLNSAKSIITTLTPGPYAGGQDIAYRVVISNVGSSRAYDVSFVDTMPAASSSATLTKATLSGVGDVSGNASIASNITTLAVGFDSGVSIGTTQTLTLEYRVTLSPSVGAGVALTNVADVDWDSLPGAPSGSRIYNDGPYENWTTDQSTVTTSAAPATLTKRASTLGPIRIGDTVTYSIDCTVPANTVAWYPSISDRLDKIGVDYVANSATIAVGPHPVSVAADFATTSVPATSAAGGFTTFKWNLGNPIDNSGNSQPVTFTLSFDVRYNGVNGASWEMWPAGTTAANSINDTASASWRDVGDGLSVPNHTIFSSTINTTVRQPLIKTTKTIVTTSTPPPYVGGSPIRYRVTFANTGYNTAYDLSATDVFPAEIASAKIVRADETGVGDISSLITSTFALPNATLTFDPSVTLSAGATITVEFDCVASSTVGAGATLTNLADMNWSTMPGVATGERVFNDSALEGATWSQDTTTVATSTPVATFSKSIVSNQSTATIGSLVMYSLNTTVPANETAYSLVVTDTIPNDLTVLESSSTIPGTVATGTPGATGTLVRFTPSPADVVGGTSSPTTFSVTFLCQVRDVRYTSVATTSGPTANSALLAWRTRTSNFTTLTASGGPATFNVVQPNLTVTKTASLANAGPGDTVTFTSAIFNNGNSPAYEVNWGDMVPSGMTTPTLVSVVSSATGDLAGNYTSASTATSLSVVFGSGDPAISPNTTVTVTWTAKVKSIASGGVHNAVAMTDTATVNSYRSLPGVPAVSRSYAPTSATRAVLGLAPALVTAKSVLGVNGAYPLKGDTVHFRYTVRNVGTAPAYSVNVTDTMPAELTYVPSSTNATWPLGPSSNAEPTIAGQLLSWRSDSQFAPGVTLNPGQTLTVNFDATVGSSAATGTIVNTATADAIDGAGGPVPANGTLVTGSNITSDTDTMDRGTANVRIVQPGVALTKVLAGSGDQYVQVGQLTGFRITVVNTGDTTLTTVPVVDTYDPALLTFVATASVAPSSSSAGSITWLSIGSIAPGAKRSIDVTFTVRAQSASGVTTNCASDFGVFDEFGHAVPGTVDTASVNVTRPSVSVSKTLHANQDTAVQDGQAVGFDLTVTNSGDTTLTTVPLSDTFNSARLSFSAASVAPATQAAGLVTWSNVATLAPGGQLAPGASVTIVATFTAIGNPASTVPITTNDTATVTGSLIRDIHSDSTATTISAHAITITRPALSIVKTLVGDSVIQKNQTVTYRLRVTNTGDTTVSTATVTDTWDDAVLRLPVAIPAGIYGTGSGTWTLTSIAPGASQDITLTLSAISEPGAQVTTDTASVVGLDVNNDPAPGGSSSASVRVTHPEIGIVKARAAGQDPQVQINQAVRYTIAVTNTGTTALTTVPLDDVYDAGALTYTTATISPTSAGGGSIHWNDIGGLALGQTTTVTVTFTAKAALLGQVVTTDTATVGTATDVYGDHPSNPSSSADIRITRPSVTILKQRHLDQDAQIQLTEPVTYDLIVTNNGNTTLGSLIVTDTWDGSALSFGSATNGPTHDSSTATWTIGPLAPNTSQTLNLTLKAIGWPASLTTTDVASVSAVDEYGDLATSTPSAADVMITHPELTVAKSLDVLQDPVVQVGDTVTFDLRMTNTGNTPLDTVPLVDTFNPAELTYVSASLTPSSTGLTTLTWGDVGPFAVNQTKIITVTYKAYSVPASQISTNSITSSGGRDVYSDPVPQADASSTIRITAPAVGIEKKLHPGQDTAVQAGAPVTYDITVTNTGDTVLTTVPVTDTYDASRIAFAESSPASSSTGPGAVHWANVGPLNPQDSTTIVATFTAISNPPGQVTTDTAFAHGVSDVYGDSAANATATADVKITHPALTLTKERVTDGAIQTSQTVTFKLTVHNTGDTTLTAVPLSDTWDADYLLFGSSLPVGATGTNFASWDVAPIAPDASAIVTVTLVARGPVPGLTTVDTATVIGAFDENHDRANDAIASAPVDITKPAVSVNKVLHDGQDQQVQLHGHVTYDIGVTNSGDTTLSVVPLTDAYDASVFAFVSASGTADGSTPGTVTWANLGQLLVGQTTTVTVTFEATKTSGGADSVDTATASGTDVNSDAAPAASDEATARVTAPSLEIQKVPATGYDPQIQPSQQVEYWISVTNTGDTTLTAVSLGDAWDASVLDGTAASGAASILSGSASWSDVAPLAPGQTAMRTLWLTATHTSTDLVSTDTATASGTDEFGDAAARETSSASVMITDPKVSVKKIRHDGQDGEIQPGQQVTYDIGVTDSGDTSLAAVPLSDTYAPLALKPVGTSPSSDDLVNDGTLNWADVGPLVVGQTTTITVTFEALGVPAGQVTPDTATAHDVKDVFTDSAPDSTDGSNIRITAPAVSLEKKLHYGQDTAVQAGDPVTFDLVVTNSGDTTLSSVPVNDVYDPTWLAGTTTAPSADTSSAGHLRWDNVGPLDPGQSTTLTASFSAISNPPGQTTIDTASVNSAVDAYHDSPNDATATAGVKITHPALTLTKTRTTDSAIQTNQTVNFDLTVTNTGDTTLTAVPLSDTWDSAYLNFFSASMLPATLVLGNATWDLGPIPPGESRTVSVVLVAFANIEGLTTTDHAAVTKAIDENGDYAPDKTDQATVDVTRPEVSVRKILHANQDHEVQVGSDVTYDIGVTNSGDTSLTTVPLSDTWDGSVFSFVSASPDASATTGSSATWNQLGTLERGQTTTVTVTLHAEATSRGAASVDTATVSRALDVNEDAAPDASATADERVTNPKIAIVKSLHAGQDHEIQPGQDATFDLAITNVGDTALSAVPLSDTWDGSVFEYSSAIPSAVATTGSSATWTNVGPIAVGQTTTVTVTLHALAPSPVLSTTDTATVSARDEYGDTAKPDTSTASLLVTRPDASIVKRKTAAQDHVVQVGQSVTYEFIVTNTGDTTLATVPLSDTFDAGALAFATATVAPDTSSTVGSVGHLGWNNLGQLAPGDSAEVTATFTAIAVPAGQISTDTALISGVTDEYHDVVADKTDPSVIRITRPGVTITKTLHAGQDPAVQASQTVTFDLVVANTGDTTLTTVPVRDVYDATWLAATGATPSLTTSSPGELDWDNVGPLDVGASTTLTVTFSARHNPPGQTTIDTATALPATDIYNDHTPSSTSTAGVKITAPSLTLTKSLDASQDPFVQAGQLVTFDLTVKNTGDTTLTTVPLSDTWDAAHFTFSTASLPASIQVGNNAAWTLGPIAPGASQTVKTTLLAVGSFTSHSLVDTATVMGALDENADHPNDALATATVDLTRGAVDVTKSLAPGQDSVVQVGQSVTFDITVQNTGDVDLAKVPLTDVFDPAVFQFTSASPSASSTAAGSATWANLGPLAVGETKTVTLTLTAIGTSALASSIDSATVSGATDIHGDPAAGDSASGGATVTHPAVSVAKNLAAGQSASVPVGTDVTYDLIVTNTGDTTLSSAALADTFDPAQLSFVSASVTPDASSAGSVSFNNVIGPLGLAPGASTRVSITLHTLVDGAGITDTALVSAATDTFGDSAGTAQADNALLGVYAPGAFSGIKTAEPPAGTIVKPGETITYTLAWNNTSAVTVPGVIASDPLPNSVRYVPGTLELGSAPQTDADDSDAGTYDSASRTVRFNVGDVAGHSGGAATFQVTVAPDNLSAAGVLNTASFSNSQGPLGSTDPVYQPVDPFKIIKTGKDLNGGKLRGGDIIEWTITVTNNGLMPTTHVHVSDNVPSTTTYVSGSISGKGADDSTAPLLKWDIGTMQVGEVQVLKLRSRVKKGLPTGTQIRNQASVVSDQSHTKKSDNPQTATAGDPTVMVAQTSGSEDWRLPLSAGLLLLAGAAVVEARRRRRTAARAAAHRAYRQSSAE